MRVFFQSQPQLWQYAIKNSAPILIIRSAFSGFLSVCLCFIFFVLLILHLPIPACPSGLVFLQNCYYGEFCFVHVFCFAIFHTVNKKKKNKFSVFLLQILSPLLDLNQNRSKLKLYISHLTSLCQERDPIILQDFAPPPAYHRSDSASWHTQLHSMTQEQVRTPGCVLSERWEEGKNEMQRHQSFLRFKKSVCVRKKKGEKRARACSIFEKRGGKKSDNI